MHVVPCFPFLVDPRGVSEETKQMLKAKKPFGSFLRDPVRPMQIAPSTIVKSTLEISLDSTAGNRGVGV
jgi:hypothetical protein